MRRTATTSTVSETGRREQGRARTAVATFLQHTTPASCPALLLRACPSPPLPPAPAHSTGYDKYGKDKYGYDRYGYDTYGYNKEGE
jgi:hypothetical protein